MRKLAVALLCAVALASSCSGTSKPKTSPTTTHPSLPVGRATATVTSCSSAGDTTTLTGKVTNPLPNNVEVIQIVGRFAPARGPAVEVGSEVQLGPNRIATFTIEAPQRNAVCSVARTLVDFVLIPGVPYNPQNVGTITGPGRTLPTPTSLVGQPLS